MLLRTWQEVKSKASTIRNIYEKGGGIIFPDKIYDKSFLSLALCPFISSSISDFVNALKEKEGKIPPPYLYFSDGKYIKKFFFLKNFEEDLLNRLFEIQEIILVSIPNLKINISRIGIRIQRDENINELLSIVGGIALCIPIKDTQTFSDRVDVTFIGEMQIESYLPTYIEAIDMSTVRIIYYGSTNRNLIFEKLSQTGVKVI